MTNADWGSQGDAPNPASSQLCLRLWYSAARRCVCCSEQRSRRPAKFFLKIVQRPCGHGDQPRGVELITHPVEAPLGAADQGLARVLLQAGRGEPAIHSGQGVPELPARVGKDQQVIHTPQLARAWDARQLPVQLIQMKTAQQGLSALPRRGWVEQLRQHPGRLLPKGSLTCLT